MWPDTKAEVWFTLAGAVGIIWAAYAIWDFWPQIKRLAARLRRGSGSEFVGGHVARKDERRGVVLIGTKRGIMEISMDNEDRTVNDICDWLWDAGLIEELEKSARR